MNNELEIKFAQKNDIPLLLGFIKDLAEYEKLSNEVTATEENLAETLFGDAPKAEVIIVYYNQKPVGFALFFYNYSTFLAKPGLYLEDLYIKPEYRGKGIGKNVFGYLKNLASERGCGRFEWSVLDWNEPAIEFYKSFGAEAMDDWTVFRIAGNQLHT